ncbi:MAG: biopolymer transporter ExbD [Bacteroidales bacterium]|jgi:biopolymer transport protein ExbD|nr:biopolymer transporter ExbD [Bacteroidales bacterium]
MANIKKTPGINASSMADISFILLIFFLMVTTMGTDYGLMRQLPPMSQDPVSDEKIIERNVFVVNVNMSNLIQAEGNEIGIGELRLKVKEFFNVASEGDNFPVKMDTVVEGIPMRLNKTAVVSLQNDRGTSYKTYIQVQNELAGAVIELRDEFCRQYYGGKDFEDCDQKIQDFVGKKVYPMAISEAEPVDKSKLKKK